MLDLIYSAVPDPTLWTDVLIGVSDHLGARGGMLAYVPRRSSLTTLGVFPIGGIRSQGWLAGGHAGYNWQYANAVAGLEIDGTATGIKGPSQLSLLQPAPGIVTAGESISLSDNIKYLGTLRGRLGWTPAPSWLLYGTGGLAWEHAIRNQTFAEVLPAGIQTGTLVEPRDQFGWAAGAGVESFIGTSNWIARLEYLHYDFGNVDQTHTVTRTAPAFASSDHGGHQTIETVRAGVSYKFTP